MKDDVVLMSHFPCRMPKGRQIDWFFFFNVFNTLYPEKLAQYLNHARTQRISANTEEEKKETIEISPEWLEMLNAIPFQSSKFILIT